MKSAYRRPPRLALSILARIADRDFDSGAAGDLEEHFLALEKERGPRRARLSCWLQIAAALPGFIKNSMDWSLEMLKNYLKIALRSLWKHKGYSFINITGLAVGMACALFILLWVRDQMSYDRFHVKAGTLFRVEQEQAGEQGNFHVNVTPFPMGPDLVAEIPEIKDAARWTNAGALLVRYGEKAFFESRARAVDPSFLTMFTFPLVQGDVATALKGPHSIVISQQIAVKYFGAEDPMGKTLTVNNAYPFSVTGVMKDAPRNSTLRPELLIPFEFTREIGLYVDSWNTNAILTWVELQPGVSIPAVNRKIARLAEDRTRTEIRSDPETWKEIQSDPEKMKRFEEPSKTRIMLMPLPDINLKGIFGFGQRTGTLEYVYTFSVVAIFVLLIACINFMNLSTARSANRAREVGLRKVAGAYRKNIAGQFYGESMLTTLLAAAVSFGLVALMLPAFNRIAYLEMTSAALFKPGFILGILAVAAVTGVVSGSYPAAFLSAFDPVRVLKGRLASGARSALFRKTLVVLQFGLSILLLIGTGVVYRQIDFMRSKKLGYDKEHLIYLPLRGDTYKTYLAFKDELLRDSRILGVTGTFQAPTYMSANGWGADWDGKDPNQNVLISEALVDFDYTETMGIEMIAGRPFSKEYATDKGAAFLVNGEVPKLMGLDPSAAVGKRFRFGTQGTIIGVMKNFHYQPARNAIEPIAVAVDQDSLRNAVIRLKGGDIPAALDYVKSTWLKINPLYPFEYRFFDEDFGDMYQADERMGTILKYFAVMAVIIACLGLFGLASYTAEQRTKEIGVRKVLGASTPGIVVLLSKEFAKWVLMANILAWPVAYFVMKNWLQGFAYRSSIAWWLFLAAGAGSLAVALITVGYQAVRAALANPAEAVKYE